VPASDETMIVGKEDRLLSTLIPGERWKIHCRRPQVLVNVARDSRQKRVKRKSKDSLSKGGVYVK